MSRSFCSCFVRALVSLVLAVIVLSPGEASARPAAELCARLLQPELLAAAWAATAEAIRDTYRAPADTLEQLRRQSRRSAWLPDLRLSGRVRSSADALDETRWGGDLDDEGVYTFDTDDHGREQRELDRDVQLQLSWDLGRSAWSGDELAVWDRSRRLLEVRDDAINDGREAFHERIVLSCQLALAAPDDLASAAELWAELRALEMLLESLTGGRFSSELLAQFPWLEVDSVSDVGAPSPSNRGDGDGAE